ncbi:MAG: OB-fold domain-containing protein [Chloroflexota bacterium]|nr:OB-fold domain-containing protein [Chloroflexota bacterium]MDE2941315.1 OB-fold domain-containing protein [Chloroflexota bacterium]MDE3268585.1 OB-fold domain-containing protein [Chloroflexota bacterium]
MDLERPVPVPDEVSAPFWDACNEGRLIVQSCDPCEWLQYPPAKTCTECDSADNLSWREVSGRGTINGYIVIHDSRLRVWVPVQPYNVAVVELEEDPTINFFSNLPGTAPDEVPVGSKVEVEFISVSDTQKIPEWRVVEG